MIGASENSKANSDYDHADSNSAENVSSEINNNCEEIKFDEKLGLSHHLLIDEDGEEEDDDNSCLTDENDVISGSSNYVKGDVDYQRIADENVVSKCDNYTIKNLPQQGAHFRLPICSNSNKISIMPFLGSNRKQGKVTTSSNIRKRKSIDHELRRIRMHEQLLAESRKELLLMGKLEMKTLIKEERRNITNKVELEGEREQEQVRELVVGRGGNQKFTFAGKYKSKNSIANMR